MLASPSTRRRGTGLFRMCIRLLLAAIVCGLLEPLLSAPTAGAQVRSKATSEPSAQLARQSPAPSALSAPAATVTQQTPMVNVAQGRIASQSTTVFGGEAAHAIDGWTNGLFYFNSVTQTQQGREQWLQVDLGAVYPIDTIDLWNRTDCCGERLHDFYVFVSDTPLPSNSPAEIVANPAVGAFFTAGAAGERTTITANRTGRYVRIALKQPGILSLAEVQVWSSGTPVARATHDPYTAVIPGNASMVIGWYTTAGAASYTLERASTSNGIFTTLATGLTAAPGATSIGYNDSGLTNDSFYVYRVRAFNSAGQLLSSSEDVYGKPSANPTVSTAAPIPATSHTMRAGVNVVEDSVLGRAVIGNISNSGFIGYNNVNFSPSPNGVSLRYRGGANTRGYFQLIAYPGEIIATVPVTNTYGAWTDANAMVSNAAGLPFLQVMFVGQGGEDLAIDQLSFSTPGPYDTATVKWDPNIVLLHKSMGIALDNFLLDQSDMTMLMQFSTTTAQGRAQFAKLKAGSIIASDTNLDLGGPFARVTAVVPMNDSQIAVKTQYLGVNQLIYAGGVDLTDAINQAFNSAASSLVGTSALSENYDPAGFDSELPSIVYQDDLAPQAGRAPGMSSVVAQTSEVPTVTVPKEGKGKRKGTFHVTMDNIQFVGDEDGFGIEFVNLRMNALGIADSNDPTTNPVASTFGFGVLGGVGFDKLRAQLQLKIADGFLARDKNIDVSARVTVKAHAQLKGLAVGMWFFDMPAKFIKPIRFGIPIGIGVLPSSLVFGLQGYLIGVGLGNLTAEYGFQITLRAFQSELSKVAEIKPFGENTLAIGQRVDNLSLLGFALEPYAKVRFGDFTFASEVLTWIAVSLGLGFDKKTLDKLDGLFVVTFTPRGQLLNILQNWKDKNRPIFEQKACVQPVVKAEALPGFPKKMTFEVRIELPIYYCLLHNGYLYYDMVAPDSVPADPQSREATIEWGVPIASEWSTIPHQLNWANGIPYDVEAAPVVESRDISLAYPAFNAAERRFCVIYRRPFNVADTVDIIWQGKCQESAKTKVKLPAGMDFARYVLRVMTEYRLFDTPLPLAETINCDAQGLPCGNGGVWSEKIINVSTALDSTTFKVNDTQVFTNSARYQDAIEGRRCDMEAKQALDMELSAAIRPAENVLPNGRWEILSAQMRVDGANVAAVMTDGASPGEKVLTLTNQNLAGGAHTITIIAKLRLPENDQFVREATYYATFRAKAKPCDEAKPDDFTALVFEDSRCAKQETPEQNLPVLDNDDQRAGETWKITGVTSPKLGTVRINEAKTMLIYKPNAKGVDSFTYEVTITKPNGFNVAKANVLVTNRAPENDQECTGAGNGGGGGGDNGGNGSTKRGKASGWGDPHLSTADRVYFDSHALGEFTYLRPKAGKSGVTVQGRQELVYSDKFPAMTTALAIKIGSRVIEFRSKKTPRVLLDGVAFSDKYVELGGGASLTVSGDRATLIGGNTTTQLTFGASSEINFEIDVPLNDTLEGLLGTPNDNPADDLRLPDGTLITGTRPDYFALADGWRNTDRTLSLFTYGTNEGPSTYNKENPYRNNIPDDTTLAPYKTQARNLLTGTCDSTGLTPDERKVDDLALELFIGRPASALAAQLCSYEISGRITSTNPAGAPVVGASVAMSSSQLNSCSATTDADGRYSCKLSPIPNTTAAPSVSVTVTGGATGTVAFPTRAPLSGTLTRTLDLAVTRPSVRLTVRTFDTNTNAAMPNLPLQVYSGGIMRRVASNASGVFTTTLTYEPGTTAASISVVGVAPAYSNSPYQYVTLNPNTPVDVTLDVKALMLGTPAWRVDGNQQFTPLATNSIPAIGQNGTIYTISYADGTRLLATSTTGARLWLSSFSFASLQNTNPVVGPDGTIYVLTTNNPSTQLHAFNPTNGSLKWTFTTASGMTAASKNPAVAADGTVYFVAGSGTGGPSLHAINPATGTAAWTVVLPDGRPTASVVVGANGTVYVPGNVLRIYSASGTLQAASTVSVRSDARVLLGADGTIFLTAGAVPEGAYQETQALNPNLSQRWRRYVGAYGGVVGPDGALYVPDSDEYGNVVTLLKLDPATGNTVWSSLTKVESVPMVAADGTVYAINRTVDSNGLDYNQLVGLNASGAVVSRFNMRGNVNSLVMGPDGRVYTTSYNGTSVNDLIAIQTSSTTGPASSWSSLYGNAQNSGR